MVSSHHARVATVSSRFCRDDHTGRSFAMSIPEGGITCHQQISISVPLSSTFKNTLHTISPGSSAASGTLSPLECKGSPAPETSATLACETKNLPETACGLNIISTSLSAPPRPPSPSGSPTSDTELPPPDKGSRDAPTDPLPSVPDPDESDHTDFRCRLYAGSW